MNLVDLQLELSTFSSITSDLEAMDDKHLNEKIREELRNTTTKEERVSKVKACFSAYQANIADIISRVESCAIFDETERSKAKKALEDLSSHLRTLSLSAEEGLDSPQYKMERGKYHAVWSNAFACREPEACEYIDFIKDSIDAGAIDRDDLANIRDLHADHMEIVKNMHMGKDEYPKANAEAEHQAEQPTERQQSYNEIDTMINAAIAQYESDPLDDDRNDLIDKLINIYKKFNEDQIKKEVAAIDDRIVELESLGGPDLKKLSFSQKIEYLSLKNQHKKWTAILTDNTKEDEFSKFREDLNTVLKDWEDAIRLRGKLEKVEGKDYKFYQLKEKSARRAMVNDAKKRFRVKTTEELTEVIKDLKTARGVVLTEQQNSVKLTIREQKKKIERKAKFDATMTATGDVIKNAGNTVVGGFKSVGGAISGAVQRLKEKMGSMDETPEETEEFTEEEQNEHTM